MKFPIFTAPSSGQGALHPDGEIGMYRGATAANALAAFASGTTVPHQKIAPAATGPRWNQFYPIPDLGASAKQLQMFQDLGAKAIIITVDQQASVYERDLHDRHLGGVVQTGGGGRGRRAAAMPRPRPRRLRSRRARRFPRTGTGEPGIGKFPSFTKYRVSNRRLWYSWDYIDEVRKFIKVPVILKGIVTAEDAEICVKEGVDGIIVSNHGGRSMDYGPSTLEVLPEIVAVVNKQIPGHDRQRLPPRQRRVQGAGAWRRCRRARPRGALGPRRVRRAGRAAAARSAFRPSSCTPPRMPDARH